jgi:Family of unknown function (DUF6446)
MTGRRLLIGMGVALVIFAAVLWWFQTRAFYDDLIGVETVEVAGRAVPVSDWQGIDAGSSPIKLRACFRVDAQALALAPEAEEATPLIAPGWFDCFDAGALTEALESGEARAVRADEGEFADTERLIAVYPDGRAYMWRQLTPKAAQ